MRRSYPTRAGDADFIRWGAKMMRALATPREAAAQYRYIFESLDVREALPLIGVPTLVLHSPLLPAPPIEHGRYIADHISGARFVEVPGDDGWFYAGDQRRVLDEVAEFLTGETPPDNVDRVLTTVLYTDIVGSTERATSLGDAQWGRLLDRHNELIDREIKRFGGRLVKLTGDGVLASFDGPARAIHCAVASRDALRAVGLEIRAGLHTGEVERRGDDLGGIALHIGARVLAIAGPGEVLVSRTVADLVAGSGIEFADRGEHELRGVSGTWRLFIVQA